MRTLIAFVTIAAIAFAPSADAAVFETSGSFAAGSPAWLATDACDDGGATEGLESNCFALPGGLDGLAYAVTATDDTGLAAPGVCFYDAAGGFIDCDTGTVPAGSASAAVGDIVGLNVQWTLTVG